MKTFSILKPNNKFGEMKGLTQTMPLYNKCSSLQPVFCNGVDNCYSNEFGKCFNTDKLTSNKNNKSNFLFSEYDNKFKKNVSISNFVESEDNRKQCFASSSKSISLNSFQHTSLISSDSFKQDSIEPQKTEKCTLYENFYTYNQNYQQQSFHNKLWLPNYTYAYSSHSKKIDVQSNLKEMFKKDCTNNLFGYNLNQIKTKESASYYSLTNKYFVPQNVVSKTPGILKDKKAIKVSTIFQLKLNKKQL